MQGANVQEHQRHKVQRSAPPQVQGAQVRSSRASISTGWSRKHATSTTTTTTTNQIRASVQFWIDCLACLARRRILKRTKNKEKDEKYSYVEHD